MSPYVATAAEVVTRFGTNSNRCDILAKWLDHRAELHKLGFEDGFQWLDGSFVEDKDPNDLDLVTFIKRPSSAQETHQLSALLQRNKRIFGRSEVKNVFRLDAFFIDLDGSPKTLVNYSRYLLGLFSHRRADDLWKGMVQVDLSPWGDKVALADIHKLIQPPTVGAAPIISATNSGASKDPK